MILFIYRDLDEKEKELQDLLRRNIILQKEIISKDAEVLLLILLLLFTSYLSFSLFKIFS